MQNDAAEGSGAASDLYSHCGEQSPALCESLQGCWRGLVPAGLILQRLDGQNAR